MSVDAPPGEVDPDPPTDPAGPGRRWPRRLRGRWARLAALVSALVLILVVGGAVGGGLYVWSLERKVEKVDAFQGLREEQRPARGTGSALNFLLVGRDEPEPGDTSARTDSIMLVHVPRTRDRAQVISIPRDTWTTVPASPDGGGPTKAKINAAYAWGGTPLLVRTVENFTGVRIDHVVLLDFTGFGTVIDVLGGVDVTVDRPFTTDVPPARTYQPGVHRMDSATALDYARQRKQFADGDFSRMRHQQALVDAVVREVGRQGILTSPARLDDFLRATAGAVRVDRGLSISETAWSLRGIRPEHLTMLTSPTRGVGMVGDQSVVFPDEDAAAKLYRAVRDDAMAQWLSRNQR